MAKRTVLQLPASVEEALQWLSQGGNPNQTVQVYHQVGGKHTNPWWLEAWWRCKEHSGSSESTAWSNVVIAALQLGARPNVQDGGTHETVPLLFGYGFDHDREVWQAWLASPGADVNALNRQGQGVLYSMIDDRQTRGSMPTLMLLDLLVEHGLDVNTYDTKGQGVAHWVARSSSITFLREAPNILEWMAAHGLDVEREDRQGWSGRDMLHLHQRDLILPFEQGKVLWEQRALRETLNNDGNPGELPRIKKRL